MAVRVTTPFWKACTSPLASSAVLFPCECRLLDLILALQGPYDVPSLVRWRSFFFFRFSVIGVENRHHMTPDIGVRSSGGYDSRKANFFTLQVSPHPSRPVLAEPSFPLRTMALLRVEHFLVTAGWWPLIARRTPGVVTPLENPPFPVLIKGSSPFPPSKSREGVGREGSLERFCPFPPLPRRRPVPPLFRRYPPPPKCSHPQGEFPAGEESAHKLSFFFLGQTVYSFFLSEI